MKYALTLATMLTALPAYALQIPEPAPNTIDRQSCAFNAPATVQPTQATQAQPNWKRPGCDPHARIAVYRGPESTQITGAVGRSLVITFAPDENVWLANFETPPSEDVKAPWETVDKELLKENALGNTLPIWAKRTGRSSLQVITMKGDAKRVYLFQLSAMPKQPDSCSENDCDDPNLMTGVTFAYPGEERKASLVKYAMDRETLNLARAEDRLKQDTFSSTQACNKQSPSVKITEATKCNFKFTMKGKPSSMEAIAPDEIMDNGRETVFVYYGNREVPLISIPQPSGPPRQVTPEPGQLGAFIVRETARDWILSKGGDENGNVLWINNVGYDRQGINPHTGTTSPGVVRVLKTAATQ